MEGGQDGSGSPRAGEGWVPLDEGELYRLWRDATDDSIGADLVRIRALAPGVHPAHRPLLRYWTEALEQLEHWLRDR